MVTNENLRSYISLLCVYSRCNWIFFCTSSQRRPDYTMHITQFLQKNIQEHLQNPIKLFSLRGTITESGAIISKL